MHPVHRVTGCQTFSLHLLDLMDHQCHDETVTHPGGAACGQLVQWLLGTSLLSLYSCHQEHADHSRLSAAKHSTAVGMWCLTAHACRGGPGLLN